jgi:hypothetical protein
MEARERKEEKEAKKKKEEDKIINRFYFYKLSK